jgi:hypothetical protein
MYYYGQGVAQNYNEALKRFRLAAEKGYAGDQNNLIHKKEVKNNDIFKTKDCRAKRSARFLCGRMSRKKQGVWRQVQLAM